jgi:hypothetical protein
VGDTGSKDIEHGNFILLVACLYTGIKNDMSKLHVVLKVVIEFSGIGM